MHGGTNAGSVIQVHPVVIGMDKITSVKTTSSGSPAVSGSLLNPGLGDLMLVPISSASSLPPHYRFETCPDFSPTHWKAELQ